MSLWISSVTVDGAAVALDDVLADLTIRHGRVDVFDEPQASSCQLALLGVARSFVKAFHTGALLVVKARDGSGLEETRFTGHVTDASLEDDTLTAIAVGRLSTLGQYAIGAGDWPAETWSARVTRAFTEAGILLDTPNVCANPGFETDLTGWGAPAGGVTLARDTAEHHSGKASAHAVTAGAVPNEWIYYQGSALEAGFNYRATFWIKGTAGAVMYAYIYNGTPTSSTFFTLTGAWQQVSCSVSSTSTGAVQFFLLTRNDGAAQVVDYHLDDVVIAAVLPVLELQVPPVDPVLAARVSAEDGGALKLSDYLGELAAMIGAAVVDRPDGRILVQPLAARKLDSLVSLDPAEVEYSPAWVQVLPRANVVNVKWVGGVETARDDGSVSLYGPREITIQTDYTVQDDAKARALEALARGAYPHWSMPAAPILAGRTYPMGAPVELRQLPASSPYSTFTPVVEGWTDHITGDEWVMDLALSDPLASGLTLPWAAVPPAETWSNMNQTVAWKDALTLSDLEL